MAHMRSRMVECGQCGGTRYVCANLDEKSIGLLRMPLDCQQPEACERSLVDTLFDAPPAGASDSQY